MLRGLRKLVAGAPKLPPCSLDELVLDRAVHFGLPAGACVLAYDPIQKLLAVGSLRGGVKLLGRAGVEQLLVYALDEPQPGPVNLLQFAPNAHTLLSVHDGGVIVVWDVHARRASARLSAGDVVTAIHAPIGSSFAYVGTAVGLILVLDLFPADGQPARFSSYTLGHEHVAPTAERSCAVVAVEASPLQDEVLLAVWADGTVALVDLYKRAPLCTFALGGGAIVADSAPTPTCASWHSGGKQLVIGYADGGLAVWSVDAPGRAQLRLSAAPETGGLRRPIRSVHWGNAPDTASSDGADAFAPALFLLGGTLLEAEPDAVVVLRGHSWSERLIFSGGVSRHGGHACAVRSFVLAGGGLLLNGGVHRPSNLIALSHDGELLLYSLTQTGVAPLAWPSAFPAASPLTAVCRLSGRDAQLRKLLRAGANPFGPWPMRGGELRGVHAEQILITAHEGGEIEARDAATRGVLPLRACETRGDGGDGGALRPREPTGRAVPLLQPYGGHLVLAGGADGSVELLWLEPRALCAAAHGAQHAADTPAASTLPPVSYKHLTLPTKRIV